MEASKGAAGGDDGGLDAPEMSTCTRLFIFIVFTQVVQGLMSYDGGATQFCTSALAAAGWSPLWLGLLGAMDKFGQVATAFVWGGVLMRHDTKPLLVVGLFWKAACCFVFGKLQEQEVTLVMQLLMLLAKLGMGVTEALISVWATVWVQRNAPHDARARWLGLAGTSAGIGNGVGSGVASLWNPIYAFFLQAFVLFVIWAILLVTPAKLFRFGGTPRPTTAARADDEDRSLTPALQFPRQMLVQQAVRRKLQPAPHESTVIVESVRLPGHYLDASDWALDHGFKVRITKGNPTDGDWAQFKMLRHASDHQLVSFESLRLPGHFLDASGDRLNFRDTRVKVRLSEFDEAEEADHAWAQFRFHAPPTGERGVFLIESVRMPRYFLNATGEKQLMGTKVCLAKEDPLQGNWAHFKVQEVTANYDAASPVQFSVETGMLGRLWHLLGNHLWLFTAFSISLCCFVTSGISFLWQNTVENVWGLGNAATVLLFITSTGISGLVGVAVGPQIFDKTLGGFAFPHSKALCMLWAKRMTFLAAVCSTACTVLLICKAVHLVHSNRESASYWDLAVFVFCIFANNFLINSVTGALYGINTDSVSEDARTFAAGLTVSFQNVFGYAFGPLFPSGVAELVGDTVQDIWPDWPWQPRAVDGAKYAAGMGSALAATWLLFLFARLAAASARLAHISLRNFNVRLDEPLLTPPDTPPAAAADRAP